MKTIAVFFSRFLQDVRFRLAACALVVSPPVASDGAVLLASLYGANEVHRYDSVTGADLGVFASGLTSPSGIGWDQANGFVYVSNSGSNSVNKYSTSGAFLGVFVSTGLNLPEDILVDPTGNVYVSNYTGTFVKKYDSFGNLLTTISTLGGRPEGLSFATNGDLLVNMYNDIFLGFNPGHTVQRFSPSGVSLGQFGAGNTLSPYGSVTDSAGNLYVANYGTQKLTKFDSAGNTLLVSGALGFSPLGLEINELGELLVSDVGGNKINRYDLNFSYIGLFSSTSGNPGYMAMIPEPSRTMLLLAGFAGVLARRRRA